MSEGSNKMADADVEAAARIIGVNRRSYPSQESPWARPEILVVLVAGDELVGDYAAYAGAGSPEWVARFGDKLCFEEASAHFPGQLRPERYRA